MARGTAADRSEELGTRALGPLLWSTCSQTTLSVSLYGVYALTNAWFVARGVGETALAAVNLVAPLLLFIGAMSTTVGIGGASLVSRHLGAGRPDDAGRAAGNAFSLFWGSAVVFTTLGLVFLDPLLRAAGATEATLPYARPYAAILMLGAIVATGFSAIVRAEGRIGFATAMWVSAVLVQITLDPLLIFGLDMGVAGAAWGTVGGQAVSAVMALWFFFVQRQRPYRVRARDLLPHRSTVSRVVGIGAPSFLTGLGATLLTATVNASLAVAGASILAAYAVASRVQTFASMPQLGITQGIQPIVGFNAGSGRSARVGGTRTRGLAATVLYGALASAAIIVAARPIARAFLDDPDTVDHATSAVRIIAIGLIFSGVPPLISAYFQAMGRPGPSYAITLGTLALLRLPLVLLANGHGAVALWIALPVGEALSALASWIVLRRRDPAVVLRPAVP
ncbi:MATE family efflux transporter [Demequina sp. NBRC 110054]|uniref:MATE family efflux transporter n=1 Tax=Demequina sp. NBRC 110054 TaxID=1570343 RepID=UPI000A0257FA|nr:MATE family efflux transporter [Demequina sp. NBRC 110054]